MLTTIQYLFAGSALLALFGFFYQGMIRRLLLSGAAGLFAYALLHTNTAATFLAQQ